MTLLDEQVDANAALAWRNFKAGTADNVLLDYSYAGYKHGEEAPADVWGLGYKVYNVVDYGADPTGVRSSRGALTALLKAVSYTHLNYADYYFLEALIRKGRLEAGEPLF